LLALSTNMKQYDTPDSEPDSSLLSSASTSKNAETPFFSFLSDFTSTLTGVSSSESELSLSDSDPESSLSLELLELELAVSPARVSEAEVREAEAGAGSAVFLMLIAADLEPIPGFTDAAEEDDDEEEDEDDEEDEESESESELSDSGRGIWAGVTDLTSACQADPWLFHESLLTLRRSLSSDLGRDLDLTLAVRARAVRVRA